MRQSRTLSTQWLQSCLYWPYWFKSISLPLSILIGRTMTQTMPIRTRDASFTTKPCDLRSLFMTINFTLNYLKKMTRKNYLMGFWGFGVLKIFELKDRLISNGGDCRTAPATPGLLITKPQKKQQC